MKKVFHKIVALTMAVVVIFSTLSFTVNMHFCGDTLVETTLFHKSDGCGMEMQKQSSDTYSFTQKKCCDDKVIVLDGQDELQQSLNNFTFEKQLFITSFVYTYINLFQEVENKEPSYSAYKPPLVVKEIFKIDEAYLI